MDAPRRRPRSLSVATVAAILAASFGVLLWTAPPVTAVTYVAGAITSDTTWGIADNEYVITQHVTVKSGVTLDIVQGTTVKMDPGRALFVEGRLIVQGFPGNEVDFRENNTASVFPPQGIQFNASSTGSVDRATFDRFERPVSAIDSSPWIGSNYVGIAFYGFYVVRSNYWIWGNVIDRATIGIYAQDSDVSIISNTVRQTLTGIQVNGGVPTVSDNVIDGATTGIYAQGSDAQVLRNQVNGTGTGIQASGGGAPMISDNAITNTGGLIASAIRVSSGTTADLWRNTVSGIQGTRGANAIVAGNPGGNGGLALAILIDNVPSATVRENAIGAIFGGRGGDGAANFAGIGGRGGDGGPAAGIVVGAVDTADVGDNTISNLVAGRGGSGGGGLGTATGGKGGDGGDAAGIEALAIVNSGLWSGNWVDSVMGGVGGSGGDGTGPDGTGGPGGDAFGIFTFDATDGDASGNTISSVRGGFGGNSTTGLGNGDGGPGGAAAGIAVNAAAGLSVVHTDSVWNVVGGDGGRGGAGGAGGNASGAYVLGKGDGNYNATSVTSNWIQDIFGGGGAVGLRAGGAGGTATGITIALAAPYLGGDALWNLQGGDGGDSNDGSDGGRGGDAAGVSAFVVPGGWSAGDSVVFASAGAAGAGPPTLASYAVGFYMEGTSGAQTTFTIENATIGFVGTLDIWAGDFADGTTINTLFDAAKLAVEATATLTVQNYLAVDLYWPDGLTRVTGATVLVEEDGTPVWNFVSATGYEEWLLTTDRVYVNTANAPDDVRNDVTISYLSYNFASNPRTVDMASSNTQTFVMIDEDDPTSTADPLNPYTTVSTFTVGYTASDGSGSGLDSISLYYRKDGAGWTPYATQPAMPSGTFSFTTVGDGTYEFATIADDLAGNQEPGPNANETWTIVDTVRPGSAVATLPAYTTTASFMVSWAPDPGVTDIARYTVQYNNGAGWTNWLVDVTVTSAVFTASPPSGVYQFRSLATDRAGNVEVAPATNDTWTLVDVAAPESAVAGLPLYTRTLSFAVLWGPLPGTTDVASYRIEVNDDGSGWTAWIPATTATSSTFNGLEGHTYAFRSIATDFAGNVETAPAGNDTWTIVNSALPGSAVAALPLWTTTQTFLVSWAPDPGVTDIATYTVQFHRGFGWTNWLVDVAQTSGMFTASQPWGVYQFRSIATDVAGNVESPPATNDTFTFVDIWAPESWVLPLAQYQTVLTFPVSWWREADDVASYRIDVRDNGGSWITWIPTTTLLSSPYTGVDGHTYEFRSAATDFAGNVEPVPAGNDTWTVVDVSPPYSTVAPLPTYTPSLTIPLTWGPAANTTDVQKYTIQVSDNGGVWTNVAGLVDTTATTGAYTGVDGHAYAFRSLAKDRAGNVELASPGNDTWTIVDITPPTSNAVPTGTAGAGGWWISDVTVTLSATDATSGVERIDYRVDGGAWQTYAGPFAVSGDGAHTVDYHGHDYAGLMETDRTLTFNIDTTPPSTTASLAGTPGDNGWRRGAVTVTLTASDPASGPAATTYRVNGGPWQTYTGPVTVATDGSYTMDFYTTDLAGLDETPGSVTFRIDATSPTVTSSGPRGSGTNTTPMIVIAFDEPMNRTSVEQGFALNPSMTGAFTWSADNRTVTFRPDLELEAGATYVVVVDSRAKDMAGNPLTTVTFSFQTAGTTAGGGPGANDFLWIIAVIAAAIGGTLLIVVRRLGVRGKPEVPVAAAKPESTATIDDVFLLYRDGILIKHETRRLKPDIDTDILSGMLTAVQSFVKDSFRSEEGELDELTFGEMHILIGRGKWLILAAMVQGDGTENFRPEIEKCISEMEASHPDAIEKWDGNMTIARTLTPYIKKLIRGDYQ